jgi:hypothetical protein
VLWTPRGGFAVTQECITTPLIPVYLAAVCAYATTWRGLVPGVLATLPLFTALGVLRLLVVALPDPRASPLFFVHAFYQLLLAAVVVAAAALWRHGGERAGPAVAGAIVGVLFVWLSAARTRAPSRTSRAGRSTTRKARSRSCPPSGRPVSRAVGRGAGRGAVERLPDRTRGARR